jgi:hypothetical protein
MKKLFILSASILLFTIAKSQDPHFGIKGGLNAATLNKGGTTETPRISFNAGAFAHIHTSANWSIQPEILFSSEGGTSHLMGGNLHAREVLNYLNFPVLLQYMFNNGLRLEGGAQFGVLLSAKDKIGDNIHDVKDLYQSTAVSIPLGASFLTKTGFGIDARYVFGLSNIYKDDSQTIQSNVFQLDIFYQFSDRWKK